MRRAERAQLNRVWTMGRESKGDLFQPPSLGLSLLEAALPPCAADNEIGDLEEEYRWRARQHGFKSARRWFWVQVSRTLWIEFKEGRAARRLLVAAGRYGRHIINLEPTEEGFRRLDNMLKWFFILIVLLTLLLAIAQFGRSAEQRRIDASHSKVITASLTREGNPRS